MAIFPYRERNITPESADVLSEISQYSLSAKAMLTALGDYWTNYYRNLEPIAAASTGAVAALSKEYTRILDLVRSANILDIPLRQSEQFRLLVIKACDVQAVYADNGEIDYFFVPLDEVVDVRYLTGSLFESPVVLEKGVHFDVEQGKGIRLYVDVFGDRGVTGYTYEIGDDSDRGILLWACDIAFQSAVIYERFGRFMYRKAIDGEQYKWLVSALMRFYENAKSVESIQNVLNIMYGVPYTRYKDEVVTGIYYVDKELNRVLSQIEEPYICIETDRAKYYTYAFSEVLYKVGDVVPQFSLLANFNKVEDYITKPGWWEDCAFPDNLVSGASFLTADRQNELMDKVLKYNTVHIKLGVSFETYATYLAQVKQFFNIIESGFPVYLYPLVDTFFRAIFLDKWEISDELLKLRLALGMESVYPWGTSLKFDGEADYYMQPEPDHGKDFKCDERLFNGGEVYDRPAKHHCKEINILHFDGQQYNSAWKRDHGNDRELLRITNMATKLTEEYPWEDRVQRIAINYSGMILADGGKLFGDNQEQCGNEEMSMRAAYGLQDIMPKPAESCMNIHAAQKPLVDGCQEATFGGLLSYGGVHPCNHKVFSDSLKTVARQTASDSYPWDSSPNTFLVPVSYANVIRADGAHAFGESLPETRPETLNVNVRRELSDQVGSKDNFGETKLALSQSDNFGCLDAIFDGVLSYSGAADCDQKVSSDSLKTVTRHRIADAYPWESSPNTFLVPVSYANVIKADGCHVFGESLEQARPEALNINVRREWSDKMQTGEIFGKSKFNMKHADSFRGISFDGQTSYSEPALPNQFGYREEFSFVCVRR